MDAVNGERDIDGSRPFGLQELGEYCDEALRERMRMSSRHGYTREASHDDVLDPSMLPRVYHEMAGDRRCVG